MIIHDGSSDSPRQIYGSPRSNRSVIIGGWFLRAKKSIPVMRTISTRCGDSSDTMASRIMSEYIVWNVRCSLVSFQVARYRLLPVCQVSHKLASTRDTRVIPSKGKIMKEPRHSEIRKEKRISCVGGCWRKRSFFKHESIASENNDKVN